VLLGISIVIGIVLGAMGPKLCAALPTRYGIAFASTRNSRRDFLVVFACTLTSLGIGLVLRDVEGDSLEHRFFLLSINAILAMSVITAAAIDLEHMILPNELTLGGAALAFLSSPLRSIGWKGALAGAAMGLALTYLPSLLYKKARGRSGMGLGDAKLALAAGAWLGWQGAISVVFLGAFQSAIAAFVMSKLGLRYHVPESVKRELAELRAQADAGDADAKAALADDPMSSSQDEANDTILTTKLPLGPFLALACIEVLFLRRIIVVHLFGWLTQ